MRYVNLDPCREIASIDLDNDQQLCAILRRDKHTRIEGICTEKLFERTLVQPTFSDYSTGWWFRRQQGNYRVIKFTHDIGQIKSIDRLILDRFRKNGVRCFIVSFDEKEKDFYYLETSKCPGGFQKKDWHKLRSRFPKKRKAAPPIPKASERNQVRLNQAIRMLASYRGLKSAALERVFANCWLASGTYWDVDCFVFHENRILAFEVKQKYPTAKGTFGLNVGLAKLFAFLSQTGIQVFHIILTKPVKNDKIAAIDFYTKKPYRDKSNWIGLKFDRALLSKEKSFAPSKTSIFGANRLRYYHILPTSFHQIGKLGQENTTQFIDFILGRTEPISDPKHLYLT
ncbi:MAG: hypothetical protein ACE5IR_04630 [bacterium]